MLLSASQVGSPRIYEIAMDEEAFVIDCWDSQEARGWKVNDWEVDDMAHLLRIVEHMTLRSDVKDSRKWNLSKDGLFSVRSCIHLYGGVGVPS